MRFLEDGLISKQCRFVSVWIDTHLYTSVPLRRYVTEEGSQWGKGGHLVHKQMGSCSKCTRQQERRHGKNGLSYQKGVNLRGYGQREGEYIKEGELSYKQEQILECEDGKTKLDMEDERSQWKDWKRGGR